MASWAKSMNKKKDVKKPTTTSTPTVATPNTVSGFIEIKAQGFKAIEKHEHPPPTAPCDDASLDSSINLKVLALKCVRHAKKRINMFLKNTNKKCLSVLFNI